MEVNKVSQWTKVVPYLPEYMEVNKVSRWTKVVPYLPEYRRISNNSYTLIVRTPPFSSKRCSFSHSNSFVHVKIKLLFYCSYSKNASTVRWRFWRPELRVNTFFCSWCRSYSQGRQWMCRFRTSLATAMLFAVSCETSSCPCSLATQVYYRQALKDVKQML